MRASKNEFLLKNIDILAVAAGYNLNQFLLKVMIHPSTLYQRFVRQGNLSDNQVNKVEKYILSIDDPWLNYIYERAASIELSRCDICLFEDVTLQDNTPKTILQTNQRAFRYFFYLTDYELSKMTGFSRDTIKSIETGRAIVSDAVFETVYNTLKVLVSTGTKEERRIFRLGSAHKIATVIPPFTHF